MAAQAPPRPLSWTPIFLGPRSMRLAYLLFCLLVIVLGGLFGALNPQPASVDFHFFQIDLRLGLALLLAALGGALVGGLCVGAGVVLPLRRRLRRQQRRDPPVVQETLPALADERAA